MTREEVYEAWAPRAGMGEAGWSDWVKPVLFAQMPGAWSQELGVPALPPASFPLPRLEGETAVVVDLPGEAGILIGLELARRGHCPVPLYNSAAEGNFMLRASAAVAVPPMNACLNIWPILAALWNTADELRNCRVPPGAAPAFLLDSRRRGGERPAEPGMLDNRWMSFPTDFPSGRMLLERGIRRACLISASPHPDADLEHTLRRWQEAGIAIEAYVPEVDAAPQRIEIARPAFYRAAWQQFPAMLGLRRNLLGGFGGWVPNSSGG